MSAYQLYEQVNKRLPLYALAFGCALSLAALPSHASPKARHKATSRAVSPAARPQKGLIANPVTNDVDSYHISYVRPSQGKAASIVLSMHLDSYEDIKDGRGSFHKRTPSGNVVVKWRREWITLDGSNNNVYGRAVSSEFSFFPAYTLTIDSPKALPVQLKTQQFSLYAVYLNGGLISKEAYF